MPVNPNRANHPPVPGSKRSIRQSNRLRREAYREARLDLYMGLTTENLDMMRACVLRAAYGTREDPNTPPDEAFVVDRAKNALLRLTGRAELPESYWNLIARLLDDSADVVLLWGLRADVRALRRWQAMMAGTKARGGRVSTRMQSEHDMTQRHVRAKFALLGRRPPIDVR